MKLYLIPFLINILLPPIIGSGLVLVYSSVERFSLPGSSEILGVTLFGYIFATIPSIGHAAVMERVYRVRKSISSSPVIIASAVSGLCCGLIIGSALQFMDGYRFYQFPTRFLIIGAATGLFTGVIVSRLPKGLTRRWW